MDSNATLPPQIKAQFALLAEYLGKAQKVALEISNVTPNSYDKFIIDLTPPEDIPDEDAWFWAEHWQAGEREVNNNIAIGEVESFDNVEDLLADLNS